MYYTREKLKNGDLLGWRRLDSIRKSDFYLNLVRVATFSDFGHVSIVWNRNSITGHVEASLPRIRQAPIMNGEIYVIPMGLDLSDSDMGSFFSDKLGLKYSARDAVLGYLGKVPREEDRYQCAELSLEFYRSRGIDLPDAYTPGKLMRQTLIHTGRPMFYLRN